MSNNRKNNIPQSPDDSVVEMVACSACGHLVPSPNLELHRIRGCNAAQRREHGAGPAVVASAPPEQEDIDMEIDDDGMGQSSFGERDISSTTNSVARGASSARTSASAPPWYEIENNNTASVPVLTSVESPLYSPLNSITSTWRRLSSQSSATSKDEDKKPAAKRSSQRSVQNLIDLASEEEDNYGEESEPARAIPEYHWECPRCTLHNPNSSQLCDACQQRQPRSIQGDIRPPDPVRREQLVTNIDDDSSVEEVRGPVRYLSGGAVIGGFLGAAGAYMRGRPISSGVLEGAMSGAMSGVLLQEVLRDSDSSSHRRRNRAQRSPRNELNPRGVIRVVRSTGPDGITETVITTRNNGRTVVRQSRSSADPMMEMMMQSLLLRQGVGVTNVDGMSYEQLLQMFGTGTENLGAEEGSIRALPTAVVEDPSQLPEDRRECAICLESFVEGETRKILPCLHGFHGYCIDKWLRTNGACPICKYRLNGQNH